MPRFAPALRLLARRPVSGVSGASPLLLSAPAPAARRLGPLPRRAVQRSALHTAPARGTPATRPHLLPEFSLQDKVVISGGARALGLVQAEALLEAGTSGSFPRPRPVTDTASR